MKRFIRILASGVLLAMVLIAVFGCSAQTYENPIVFEQPLVYSFQTMRLEQIQDHDIVRYASSPATDLITAIQTHLAETNPTWLDTTKIQLILKLGELSEASDVSLKTLTAKSGSEFNALALEAGIALTIDDVIAFADLKAWLTSADSRVFVTRIALFEAAMGRTLTSEEAEGLSDLQTYLSDLARYGESVQLETMEEAELRTSLEERGYSVEKVASAITGYLLVKELMP